MKNRNMKFSTQLGIGFAIIDALLIALLYIAYTTAAQIITVEDPEHYLSSFATLTAVLFVAVLVISGGISVTMVRIVKKSTDTVVGIANKLASGDVNIEIDTSKLGKNEFDDMIRSLSAVVENVRYQAEAARIVAGGDLTVAFKESSEVDLMGNSLRKLIVENNNAITSIKEAAYQVGTSSSQVASASEALAQGSTEQASAIEQITASITDVAEKTRQNASLANTAEDLMTQAIEEVRKGNEEMKEMVLAMQDINKSSESISKIIKVIDDIAFQTNILALNAAVEAARAGEAGKGFAVVAEEVRNLAAKSASAAAETAELIEDSIQKVGVGTKIANGTAAALEEITGVVKESETIVKEIAESSNYQATAIAQIDQAVEQVSQVVQTNSATSEECAAASVELSNQASRVQDMLSVYKLIEKSQGYMSAVEDAGNSYETNADNNEQVISLTGNFGKY